MLGCVENPARWDARFLTCLQMRVSLRVHWLGTPPPLVKILIAHNRYQQPGGEDAVVAQEVAMLARRGHEVELLAVDNDSISGIPAQLTAAVHSFYSRPSYRRARKLLHLFRPEIVHVHNVLPTLSPSIFFAANDACVPVVQTLHNYRLLCAKATLFRDGSPCEDCLTEHTFRPGVVHACYRGSRVGSAVIGAGTALHTSLGTWSRRVDRYIALTAFAAEKLSARVPLDRLRIKPNFVADRGTGTGGGEFALFAGRLSQEKGIDTLLAADALGALALPVKVAGDGPMMDAVQAAAARPGSRLIPLGRVATTELEVLMKQAAVLLVPSLWYEGFPMVIAEALSFGLPVIASRIGGLPEIVEEGISGLLYQPGDPHSLLSALGSFAANPEGAAAMRLAARRRYLERYTEDANYAALMDIYNELTSEARSSHRSSP
jgi:glycosyltransferase involved in cell wall biosynthesis